jgi:hypothetical protein
MYVFVYLCLFSFVFVFVNAFPHMPVIHRVSCACAHTHTYTHCHQHSVTVPTRIMHPSRSDVNTHSYYTHFKCYSWHWPYMVAAVIFKDITSNKYTYICCLHITVTVMFRHISTLAEVIPGTAKTTCFAAFGMHTQI